MTATPTPGDLSARHVEVLREFVCRYAGQIDNRGEYSSGLRTRALDAIAALSALLAAGGLDTWQNRAEREKVATPQPSAAEDDLEASALAWMGATAESLQVASRGDGILTLARALTGWINSARTDAAVGAQGDGEGYRHSTHHVHRGPAQGYREPESIPCYCSATTDHAIGHEGGGDAEFWAERLDMLAEVHGCGSTTMKTCADLIRRLAAPAAGKGVDDATLMEGWHGAVNDASEIVGNATDERIRKRGTAVLAWLQSHPPALTRQPVAGDGVNGRAWKVGDRVIWTSRFGKPFAGTVTCVRDPIPVRYEVELDDGALCDPLGHELTAAPAAPTNPGASHD